MKEYPILKSKLFLYITEFFAGVSVMAVELGASRLLAPYFSSSQIVWTIIIGTIMIAMALGNLYGGRAADKNPDPALLYRRILIAAVWIAAIPVLGKYVILGVSALLIFTVSTNFLVIAAFVSCMLLFVYPLFLLGTVTPSLVKATVDSLDDSGRTVGRLGACNTVGSILGTFLPTFVTIPAVGTAVSFLIFSGVLLVIALIYFLSEKTKLRAVIIAVVLFLLCLIFGRSTAFAFWENDLSYEGESVYNYLQVKEDEKSVVFATNVLFGVQSVMMKDGGLTGMYYDYALAAPVICAKEEPRVLVLGNGTGTYARQCLNYFPSCTVEGVEIDGKITELAGRFFDLPDAVKVTEYDGRAFLQAVDTQYDVILVDAYQDITIPFQMSTVEFFTMVREHLKPGGVMAVNMNMHSDGEGSINEALCDTIAAVRLYAGRDRRASERGRRKAGNGRAADDDAQRGRASRDRGGRRERPQRRPRAGRAARHAGHRRADRRRARMAARNIRPRRSARTDRLLSVMKKIFRLKGAGRFFQSIKRASERISRSRTLIKVNSAR